MVGLWDLDLLEMDGDLGDAGLPGATPPEGWTTSIEQRLSMLEGLVIPQVITDLGDVDLTGIGPNDLVQWNGDALVKYTPQGIVVSTVMGTTFDGGGDVIPAGQRWDGRPSVAAEITGYTVLADQVGSLGVAVWKDAYSNYPPTSDDLIFTMTVSSANRAAVTLGSPIPIAATDCIRLNVTTATAIQRATCQFTIRRTLPWGPGA
jgi:hypothetical protein